MNWSTKCKSTYLFRTIPTGNSYSENHNEKLEVFVSTLFSRSLDDMMRKQESLPYGKRRLGIDIKVNDIADLLNLNSKLLMHNQS